jgi:hypothetical protein
MAVILHVSFAVSGYDVTIRDADPRVWPSSDGVLDLVDGLPVQSAFVNGHRSSGTVPRSCTAGAVVRIVIVVIAGWFTL